MPLDAGSLGFDFGLPATFEQASSSSAHALFLRPGHELRLGASTVERFESDEWVPKRDVRVRGNEALIQLRDRCDVLTVRVSTRALETPGANEGFVHGGVVDGHVLCTEENKWRVRAGAPVFWPSGEPAGEVTSDDGFATEPHRVGGLLCFSERLQLVANAEALCFAPNDVVRAAPGQRKRGVVPPCDAGRVDATAKALIHLPNWAVPADAGVALSVGCDVMGHGKLACCDMPPMEQASEVMLRRALYDTTSPLRPDGGDFLRVEVLLVH